MGSSSRPATAPRSATNRRSPSRVRKTAKFCCLTWREKKVSRFQSFKVARFHSDGSIKSENIQAVYVETFETLKLCNFLLPFRHIPHYPRKLPRPIGLAFQDP